MKRAKAKPAKPGYPPRARSRSRTVRVRNEGDDSTRINTLDDSVRRLMSFIAELRLDVETCRVLLQLLGMTQEELDLAKKELKKEEWDAAADVSVQQSAERRAVETLRQLLAGRGRTTKGH
jgi:hypothetical protein